MKCLERHRIAIQHSEQYDSSGPPSGEHLLWCAVLERACRDAMPVVQSNQIMPTDLDRLRVRAWASTQDCRDVCDYAGVDYSKVKAHVLAFTADLA